MELRPIHCNKWVSRKAETRQWMLTEETWLLPIILHVNSSERLALSRHDKTSRVVTHALYVPLSSDNEACMRHASRSRRKKSNHTTLEHCLWFWHHIKDPLFCGRQGKISDVVENAFLIIHQSISSFEALPIPSQHTSTPVFYFSTQLLNDETADKCLTVYVT